MKVEKPAPGEELFACPKPAKGPAKRKAHNSLLAAPEKPMNKVAKGNYRTTEEEEHLRRVRELPCGFCKFLGLKQTTKTESHHLRRFGEAANDWRTIPASWEFHSDQSPNPDAIHNAHKRAMDLEDIILLDTVKILYPKTWQDVLMNAGREPEAFVAHVEALLKEAGR